MNTEINTSKDTLLDVSDGWRIFATQHTAQLYLFGKNYIIFINGEAASTRLILAIFQGLEKIEFSAGCDSDSLTFHYAEGQRLSLVNFTVDEDSYEIFENHKPGLCIVSPAVIVQYGHPPILQEHLPSDCVLEVLHLLG